MPPSIEAFYGTRNRMRLHISTIPEPILEIPDDLTPLLTVLAPLEGAFFELVKAEHTYLRGDRVDHDRFLLQFSEPSMEGYREYKTPVESTSAALIANHYASGAPDWLDDQHWDLVITTGGDDSAALGFFDGIALRLVINALERNELDVRVEPLENGFLVFTTEEHAPEAKQLIAGLFPV